MGPRRRRSPASIRGEPAANGRGGSQTPARGGGAEEERAGAPATEGAHAPEAAAAGGSEEVAAAAAAAAAGTDEGEAWALPARELLVTSSQVTAGGKAVCFLSYYYCGSLVNKMQY